MIAEKKLVAGRFYEIPEQSSPFPAVVPSTFRRNDCRSFHYKETPRLGYFRAKARSLGLAVRERNTSPRQMEIISFTSKLLCGIAAGNPYIMILR